MINDNSCQYQYIIFIVVIYKAYKDTQAKAIATISSFKYSDLNKFALQTFNKFVYK